MSDTMKKEFQFTIKNSELYTNGKPGLFVIEKVNEIKVDIHKKYISDLKEEFKSFILFGTRNYSFEWDWEWERELRNSQFINDKIGRLEFSKKETIKALRTHRAKLSLISWNIKTNSKMRPFSMETWKFLATDIKEEIEKRILEMNPSWVGETDTVINQIETELRLKDLRNNFADLSIKNQSVFTKSKQHILSLLKEINQHVFDNRGTIVSNVKVSGLGIRNVLPPPENIILRLPNNLMGHIGVVEHGNYELKIVAKRHKSNSWDCEIDEIVNKLRHAIKWWKDYGAYTENEIEEIEAAKGDAEGMATYRDLLSMSRLDEDDY